MYRMFYILVLLTLTLNGEELSLSPTKTENAPLEQVEIDTLTPLAVDVSKISEAFGHLIGKNLESIGFKFDMTQIIKGLEDAQSGKDSPMTEMECVQAITSIQESVFKQQSTENLLKANEFLAQNMKIQGIISIETEKLQYRIDRQGTGAVVEEHFSPLIRYKGTFLDGTVFGSSKENELISLDETMPGFTKGLIGMKEGEIRTLYIHPDLGYGTSGYLPPNSLLTFEIEVIKANAPVTEPADSLSTTHPKVRGNPEIALPGHNPKAIR